MFANISETLLVIYVIAVIVNVCLVLVPIFFKRKDSTTDSEGKHVINLRSANNLPPADKNYFPHDNASTVALSVSSTNQPSLSINGEYLQSIAHKASGLEHNLDELNKFFATELTHQKELLNQELQTYKEHRIAEIESNLQTVFHKVVTDVLAAEMTEEMEVALMKKFIMRFKQEVYEK